MLAVALDNDHTHFLCAVISSYSSFYYRTNLTISIHIFSATVLILFYCTLLLPYICVSRNRRSSLILLSILFLKLFCPLLHTCLHLLLQYTLSTIPLSLPTVYLINTVPHPYPTHSTVLPPLYLPHRCTR